MFAFKQNASMTAGAYKQAFDVACSEMQDLLRHRADVNGRIDDLRRTILALASHVDLNMERKEKLMRIIEELGVFAPRLTDAIKDALYSAYWEAGPRRLPAIQVKELLEVRGFDFSGLVNPLASVHSTLRRLATQKAIGSAQDQAGSTIYWWNGPHYGTRLSLANVLELDRKQSGLMQSKIGTRVQDHFQKAKADNNR